MRRNFSSSRLVRLLGDAASTEGDASRQDFAERLSQWVGVFDAVKLHAAQQSMQAAPEQRASSVSGVSAGRAVSVEEQVRQVRAVLTKGIVANEAAEAGERRARNPRSEIETEAAPALEKALEMPADFAPYRKRYLDQQRHMELMIAPLRAHLRQALAEASPRLRPLAELDAVWERMLEAREQSLLSTVPVLLKRRFEHLRKAHIEDAPALWRQPGGWLEAFDKALQEVLLAELDHRLEPVVGLMEAFSKEIEKTE